MLLLTFLKVIYLFSMDPWKNFGRGITKDSELFGIGNGIFQVITAFGQVGAVINLMLAFIMHSLTSKKKDEAKEKASFICYIICLICLLPTILNMITGAISNLFVSR